MTMRELPGLQGAAGATIWRAARRCRPRSPRIGSLPVGLLLIIAGGCSKPDPAPAVEAAAPEQSIVSVLPQGPAAMPPKDSALVEAGRAIARVMGSSGELWPGFAPEAILVYWPFAPVPAVLVTAKTPPEGWHAVAAAETEGAPAVYFREGELRGLVGNIALDYRVGDISATALVLDVAVAGTLNLGFHEAFHFFQRSAFANARQGDPYIPDSLVADPEFLALQEVEIRLLRAALDESVHARRTDILHRYLAVRSARLARVDPRVEAAEQHWELIEGTASWVGPRAATLHSPTARRDLARKIRANELRDLLPRNQSGFADRVVRWRSRAVGAALAVFLDEAGARWQPVAESGRSLPDLLERTLGDPPRSAEHMVREAKQAAGYDTLIAMRRSWLDTLSGGTLRRDFEARRGFRMIVDIEARPGADGRMRFPTYNLAGVGRSPDPSTTIYGRVSSFSINDLGILITARNADLMVERRAQAPVRLTLIVDELPSFPRLRSFRAGALDISGPDFTLKATRATANKESDSLLHVVIRR